MHTTHSRMIREEDQTQTLSYAAQNKIVNYMFYEQTSSERCCRRRRRPTLMNGVSVSIDMQWNTIGMHVEIVKPIEDGMYRRNEAIVDDV